MWQGIQGRSLFLEQKTRHFIFPSNQYFLEKEFQETLILHNVN
ncbi:hypothetical protein CPter291_5108 [Collimonas pratensis]|uniref:Uncharacterized protein n=1 Tax=Collimonas pratensis TaxID=279113 RepID=A0A127R513_9BURK|nr:hypothetical protein CPter91_5301 [Collimonas pratensis]AMP17321.1 hypothetical protein CPter291_5108 [Collimonas pratensis]